MIVLMEMMLFLFSTVLKPMDSLSLAKEFTLIRNYDGRLYFAPFIGKSIFLLDENERLQPITFTDDINYRIYDFHITPFALYLSNGVSIEKFYLKSGIKEKLYSQDNISAFVITPSEELIIAEEEKNELIFLDFMNKIKFKKFDLKIKDIKLFNKTIYILTNKELLFCDEYGNIFDRRKLTGRFEKLFVTGNKIILFSAGEKEIYILNGEGRKNELPHTITDIAEYNEFIVILDGYGSTLYFYKPTDF